MNYDFCKIKNADSSAEAVELFFYGDIVSDSWPAWRWEDQYPDNVRFLLKDIGDRDVNIRINSGGGDVFAGNTICNLLKSLKGKKTVYIDGIAASIASVIAMAGDEIIMPDNAMMMIHKPFCMTCGTSAELRGQAEVLDKVEQGMIATYMSRTADGVDETRLSEMLAAETWLTANEAAEVFSTINVTEPLKAAAHCSSDFLAKYKNLPQGLADKPKDPDMTEFEECAELYDALYGKL